MTTRFQSHIQGRSGSRFTSLLQSHYFGMGLSRRTSPTLAHHPAILDKHRSHRRIRQGSAFDFFRLSKGQFHEPAIQIRTFHGIKESIFVDSDFRKVP